MERNGEEGFAAFVKIQPQQFAAGKRYVVQSCFGKPGVAPIAIGKDAIHKAKVGEVCFGKMAVDEFAGFVFGGWC